MPLKRNTTLDSVYHGEQKTWHFGLIKIFVITGKDTIGKTSVQCNNQNHPVMDNNLGKTLSNEIVMTESIQIIIITIL